MKKVIALSLIFYGLTIVCAIGQGINFDDSKQIVYIAEDIWCSLPVVGTNSKTEILKPVPPGWEIRGMYTNKLLAVIKSSGKIDFK